MALTRLFEPYQMGGVPLRNRIVLAGHGSRFIDPHTHQVTDRQAHYLAERAKGGVGLIIQGSAMVHPTGLSVGFVNHAWDDSCIPSYARLTEAVHQAGAPIFCQLSHLGRQGTTFGMHRELWAPSAIADPASRIVPHAMTKRDIRDLVNSYASASRRLLMADFDGLEVYMAHGYLLCSFLSSYTNKRTDEYGGSLVNRMRLPLEILAAVRDAAGSDVPVGIRISAEEFVPDGLHPEEAKEIVSRLIAAVPTHYISVTQSNYATLDRQIPDMSFPRAPFVGLARDIRTIAKGVPVFAVARIVDPEKGEELLENGTADFVAMVRPLIADPELPNKAKDGRLDEIRRCISCNDGCRGGPLRGEPIACLVNPVVGFEDKFGIGKIGSAVRPRNVVVVGGGPGGLKAAETVALRGHRVTLIEAKDILGGTVLVAAAAMPYRDEFANSVRFLERRCRRLGVDIRTGVKADRAILLGLAPDAIVLATGSIPGRPGIPGDDLPHVVSVQAAILKGVSGRRVLVVDGGEADWKAATTAEHLAAAGHEVIYLSPLAVAAEIDSFSRMPLQRRVGKAASLVLTRHSVVAIEPDRVTIRDNWSGREEILDGVESVVLSWYGVADDSLARDLEGSAPDVHLVGDALAPRRAIDAIWDGFRIGMAL
jgi:2,4-dienoyl-CoA reductase-like NADH-dependent reductase (Old Yellow Enzyme family)